ncbi:MAG: tRNA pseudouridine(38-40) synthase TruA [Bacteroidales bacterium]
MVRYFMEIAYDGSNYHGWQKQPNAITVQEIIEKGLTRLLRENITVTGCGRTDSGVHARSFYLHFDLTCLIDSIQDFNHHVNSYLPDDIAVYNIIPVNNEAHARFDAISRTYHYYLHTMKDPFLCGRSMLIHKQPDVDAMNAACTYLVQHTDFTSFSKLHTDTKTNLCHIQHASWQQNDHRVLFKITADRFLRNMVRAIVGSVLPIGYGIEKPEHIESVIEAHDRSAAGQSVPAHGLYLIKTEYPKNTLAI